MQVAVLPAPEGGGVLMWKKERILSWVEPGGRDSFAKWKGCPK